MSRLPTFFISHGGGPWPYMPEMRIPYANTALAISSIPASLPAIPKAILVITGHWEAPEFTVSTALQPSMEYDYSGFPEHTYHIRYPAQGSPVLAARVRELLGESGIATSEDAHRGFDHGTFVPLGLMYPDADIPVVLLSLKSGYDPSAHIQAGQALQSGQIRDSSRPALIARLQLAGAQVVNKGAYKLAFMAHLNAGGRKVSLVDIARVNAIGAQNIGEQG